MNTVTLPSSPTWYRSRILACSENGIIAWGTRNNIVIARQKDDSKTLQYSVIQNAHTEKVNCLAFSSSHGESNKYLLISSGNEHIARVWDIDNLSAIKAYSYADTEQMIAAVDWSRNPDIACIVSVDGLLVSWNLSLDINTSISLGKTTATSLSCCPHDTDLVAVGAKNGLVYIVNVAANTRGAVMYKLRGHDVEVVSLSWCPKDTNVISSTGKRDLLLASGGKDKSIFIWRAGGDGRYEAEIAMPKTPLDVDQHRSKLNAAVGNWAAVCWIRPTLLLATSPWGELISCQLSSLNSTEKKSVWKLIHGCHTRGLFCISQVPKTAENSIENWREDSVDTIWTTGQDRRVVCCTLTGQNVQIEYTMPTQGGFVYCIAACPLETSRVAFGIGDATLYLWNLSEPHETSFDITVLWQRIQAHVRTISWHPEKENILAYATDDGRVGIIDTNERKLPTILRPYHRSTVYNLGWGVDPDTKKDVLFSCADEELVYHHIDQPKRVPTVLFAKKCTSFGWKPDFSCLAVGFNTGSITFLDKNLVERHRSMYPLKKGVFCLSWHPDSTATDVSFSPLRHYLAVAADASPVIILDLSEMIEEFNKPQKTLENNESEKVEITPKVVAMLNGHTERVVCLAWSPHFSGHLVSGSYDGTAQVWNVETQQLMGTFTGHYGRILSCIWSPLDPDLIITGGTDFTIHVWRLSQQSPIMPKGKTSSKKSRSKKNKEKASKKHLTDSDNAAHKPSSTPEDNATANGISNDEKLTIDETTEKSVADKLVTEKSKATSKSTSESKKSLILNSIRKLIKHAQCKDVDLKNIESEDITPSLFSNEKDFSAFLNARKSNYISQGMHDMVTEMSVWSNNLKESLEQAVKEKRLNDFLVSLAPSLSTKTWMEMCDAYAIQLISEGNCRKAVSYLLCIHKIPQAVQVLVNANMYKEAYTLARCKLDPEDKLIETVLRHWAEYAAHRDCEEAAQCYAKLGDFSMAAKVLKRRDDAQCFEIAAELASAAGESEFCQSLAEQAIAKLMLGSNYTNAYRLVEKFPEISYRKVHISVFQEIKKAVQKDSKINDVFKWLQGECSYGLFQDLSYTDKERHTYYADLCRRKTTFKPDNESKLWINISYDIAMALMCDKEEKRLQHIISALDSISQFEIQHLQCTDQERRFLIDILCHLDMKSPTDHESIYAKNDYPVCKSLRAYLCVGLLHWVVRGLKNATIEDELQSTIKVIETLLEDVFDRQTVKFWSMTNEINKLEAKISSVLGTSNNTDGEGDGKEDITALVTKLDEIKSTKKQFIDERISAPCPIIAYSLANELIDRIPDEAIKTEFTAVLTKIWTNAINQ